MVFGLAIPPLLLARAKALALSLAPKLIPIAAQLAGKMLGPVATNLAGTLVTMANNASEASPSLKELIFGTVAKVAERLLPIIQSGNEPSSTERAEMMADIHKNQEHLNDLYAQAEADLKA